MSFISGFVLLDKPDNFPPSRLIMRTLASRAQIKAHFCRWNHRNEIMGGLLGPLDLTSNSSPVKSHCTLSTEAMSDLSQGIYTIAGIYPVFVVALV